MPKPPTSILPTRRVVIPVSILALICFAAIPAFGQRAAWHNDDLPFRRAVDLSEEMQSSMEMPSVVVADFFTHGELRQDGANLLVYERRNVVPFRVLQIGPGDYCRVAFETQGKVPQYYIYYGGDGNFIDVERPEWTVTDGLMMETRRWQDCDLNSLDSVRKAFASSPRLGSDYVPRVFHRHNPFDIATRPFLTRYVGLMHVPLTGKVTFFTSSQDCSFLLVDGKLVVSAPGRHPPETQAKIKGEIVLDEGPHWFEYIHAAGGDESCMVAAWQLPGFDAPSQISPSVFRDERIARLPAANLEHRTERYLPDFRFAILGDVPSPEESEPAMVRVQFADTSMKSISSNAKYQWDFGDGQTGDQQNPGHVYLHPKYYVVTMTLRRGASEMTIANRVQVIRSIIVEREQDVDVLASYIEMLEQYNAQQLDPMGLLQLVRAYIQIEQYAKAVAAGKMAFTIGATLHTDESRWEILKLLGPLMRFKLDDPSGAAQIYRSAVDLIGRREWRVACAIETADVLLNDLLLTAEAKPMLDFATERQRDADSVQLSKLNRVWGDFYARTGDGKAAKSAYMKARSVRDLSYTSVQEIAWRGAYSRSSEAFLREGDLQRMREELTKWLADFPADKVDGYLSLQQAGFWKTSEKYPQAIAVANDLLTVNPNSPYADRLLYLIAQCEELLGRKPRAAAAFQSLVTDYPGSPLVDHAREQLKRLQAGSPTERLDPAKPNAPKRGAGN